MADLKLVRLISPAFSRRRRDRLSLLLLLPLAVLQFVEQIEEIFNAVFTRFGEKADLQVVIASTRSSREATIGSVIGPPHVAQPVLAETEGQSLPIWVHWPKRRNGFAGLHHDGRSKQRHYSSRKF